MATRRFLSAERGMTAIELLVSTAVMLTVLGVTTSVLVKASTMFTQQQTAMDGRNGAAAGMDLMARLLRQSSCTNTAVYCQSIFPDPFGNGAMNAVRVTADWNPRDGDLLDPYENVIFTANAGTLWKREPNDVAAVEFAAGVQSIAFAYLNQNGAPLTNAVARPDLIGAVRITIVSTGGRDMPNITSSSTVSVRRIK